MIAIQEKILYRIAREGGYSIPQRRSPKRILGLLDFGEEFH